MVSAGHAELRCDGDGVEVGLEICNTTATASFGAKNDNAVMHVPEMRMILITSMSDLAALCDAAEKDK